MALTTTTDPHVTNLASLILTGDDPTPYAANANPISGAGLIVNYGGITVDQGGITFTTAGQNITGVAGLSGTGQQVQGGVAGGAGTSTWFTKEQTGLVLPTGALVVTLFTITIPNVAAGGGFTATFTATNKTSPGASSRTASINGSFQRVAAAAATGAVSALGSNVQADNGGGHALTFGALAATETGGATAVNTIAITCSITGATNTDTFDLTASVQLLNNEVNGATLS